MGCSSSQAAGHDAGQPQAAEHSPQSYHSASQPSEAIGPDAVDLVSPPESEGGIEGLSSVMMETAQRRVRLITDNRGRLEDLYELDREVIGQGSFGSVSKAKSRETGASRAIKSLSKDRGSDTRRRFRQEILIMKMVDHPNIIRLFETFEDKKLIYLVMELCTGGDLSKRLKQVKRFSEAECAVLMEQILRPVTYLHSQRLCHRDLKPENFLLLTQDPVGENTLKMVDFGLACTLNEGEYLSTKLGTVLYSSPQVLEGRYGDPCDVWSCGVMMYVLLSGQHPFQGKTDAEVMATVKRGNYRFQGEVWNKVSDDAKDLIRSLLRYKEWERTSAERALTHSWLAEAIGEGAVDATGSLLKPSLLLDLREFCGQSLLRRAALQVLSQHLSEADCKAFRRTFKALDTRGAGAFTLADLEESLRSPQFREVRNALQGIISELGGTNQEIGYTDFLAATLSARHYMQEGPCRAAFRVFDSDSDGLVSHQELHQVLFGTEDGMSRSLELLRSADLNDDGFIDFEEFKAALRMQKTP
mmetsp:Transcript_15056/g.45123  ORF Transcript_15056/g.45123 Transcript_15056/m.45123 type:complete len:529 (-) Transcript_15056:27-1613(-)